MKCIEGEYGNICKEGGLFSKKVVQTDEKDGRTHEFSLSTIKKVLKEYNRRTYKQSDWYGMVETKDGYSYRVYFNAYNDSVKYPISIGCKYYSKETVDRAIKAFL